MGYRTLYKRSDKPGSMLFVSHGGGPLPLMNDPRHANLIEFLKDIPARLIAPSAILVISAHWEEAVPTVQSGARPSMYYDYYGFPEESYGIAYPSPGVPDCAVKVKALLDNCGVHSSLDPRRGYDHGVFVPLMLMYPDARIPCFQLSLVDTLDPQEHLNLGKAIQGIRDENILIIGSGASFHNLSAFRQQPTDQTRRLNNDFEKWLRETLTDEAYSESRREQRLANWQVAPGARYCHPRVEHLLPLHVCYGIAGGPAEEVVEVQYMDRISSMYLWT